MTERAERFEVAFRASANVRLRVPPGRGAPPRACLLALHGYGQDLDAFFAYACALDPQAVVVMPEGPMSFYRGRTAPGGRRAVAHAWIAELPREAADRRNDAFLAAALDAVRERVAIDPARTAFLGFSQGVGVALHFLLAEPERARGLVGLAGGLAPAYRPDLVRLAGKDVLWITGEDDPAYPPAYEDRLRAALGASGANLETHVLAAGHDLLEPAAEHVRAWLAPRLGLP